MATILPGRGTGASSSTPSSWWPSIATRSADAPSRRAAMASGPWASRSTMVAGPAEDPPASTSATGIQRSTTTMPSVSREAYRQLMRRKAGSTAFSILVSGRGTGRYATVGGAVNFVVGRQKPPAEVSAMPYEPTDRRPIGNTGLRVTTLGFGGGPIGGLFTEVADTDAKATVERAWDLGIRYFDTAPLYGYGNSERRIGSILSSKPRDTFALSTKVGRLI